VSQTAKSSTVEALRWGRPAQRSGLEPPCSGRYQMIQSYSYSVPAAPSTMTEILPASVSTGWPVAKGDFPGACFTGTAAWTSDTTPVSQQPISATEWARGLPSSMGPGSIFSTTNFAFKLHSLQLTMAVNPLHTSPAVPPIPGSAGYIIPYGSTVPVSSGNPGGGTLAPSSFAFGNARCFLWLSVELTYGSVNSIVILFRSLRPVTLLSVRCVQGFGQGSCSDSGPFRIMYDYTVMPTRLGLNVFQLPAKVRNEWQLEPT
jgi:hypothetical protein